MRVHAQLVQEVVERVGGRVNSGHEEIGHDGDDVGELEAATWCVSRGTRQCAFLSGRAVLLPPLRLLDVLAHDRVDEGAGALELAPVRGGQHLPEGKGEGEPAELHEEDLDGVDGVADGLARAVAVAHAADALVERDFTDV